MTCNSKAKLDIMQLLTFDKVNPISYSHKKAIFTEASVAVDYSIVSGNKRYQLFQYIQFETDLLERLFIVFLDEFMRASRSQVIYVNLMIHRPLIYTCLLSEIPSQIYYIIIAVDVWVSQKLGQILNRHVSDITGKHAMKLNVFT